MRLLRIVPLHLTAIAVLPAHSLRSEEGLPFLRERSFAFVRLLFLFTISINGQIFHTWTGNLENVLIRFPSCQLFLCEFLSLGKLFQALVLSWPFLAIVLRLFIRIIRLNSMNSRYFLSVHSRSWRGGHYRYFFI